MGTLIPGPTPGPTCIWMELRYARPRPAQRGPLGSHPARGQACPGSVALQFSGEAAQSGSSSAGTRVMGALPPSYRSRPAPPAPHPLRGAARPAGRANTNHRHHPSRGNLQLIRFCFSPALFSDVFLLRFILFWRAEWGPGKQTQNQARGGEVGSKGPWRRQVLSARPRGAGPTTGPLGPPGRSAVVVACFEA